MDNNLITIIAVVIGIVFIVQKIKQSQYVAINHKLQQNDFELQKNKQKLDNDIEKIKLDLERTTKDEEQKTRTEIEDFWKKH